MPLPHQNPSAIPPKRMIMRISAYSLYMKPPRNKLRPTIIGPTCVSCDCNPCDCTGEIGDNTHAAQVATKGPAWVRARIAYEARCTKIRATLPKSSPAFANAMSEACATYEAAMVADIGARRAAKLGAGVAS